MTEKLRSLGVGPKVPEWQRNNVRKETKVQEKRMALATPKSFANVVARTEFRISENVVKVRVGKDEIEERLGQLDSCLVGWWGGGTSPIPNLKSLKHRAWSSWEVKGYLNVEEMGKGLWLFGFKSPNEVRRILREGTRRLGGLSISIRKWGKDVECKVGSDKCKTVWVRLLGLPLHLWSRPVLKCIGDRCGGFVAVDENKAFLSDLCWARIRVKWDGSSNPPSAIVSEGDSSFVIRLWWEIQPQMMSERAMMEPKGGDAPREEGGVSTRARECVETLEHCVLKVTEGTEEVNSCKERKSTPVELQTSGGEPVRGPGCSFSLGPTYKDQGSRQVW